MNQTYSIWIDANSGTWGDARNIRFTTVTDEELDTLDQMSDNEIIELAKDLTT